MGDAADDTARAGTKRRRVTFASSAAAERDPDSADGRKEPRRVGPHATAADLADQLDSVEDRDYVLRVRKARAEAQARDSLDDAKGAGYAARAVIEETEVEGYDDVGDDANDEGLEEEFAGRDGLTGRERTGGGDVAEEGKASEGKTKVKTLKRAVGEDTGPDEEFNERGDAVMPFHLDDAREEGYYDPQGNFVWKKRSAEDYDPWMDELDTMDPRERARLQRAAAQARVRTRGTDASEGASESKGDPSAHSTGVGDDDNDEEEAEDEAQMDPVALARVKVRAYRSLLAHVCEGETVAQALRRYGKRPAGKAGPPAAAGDASKFDAVTEAADALFIQGETEVYGMTRSQLRFELADALEDAGEDAEPEPTQPTSTTTHAPPMAAASTTASSGPTPSAPSFWRYRWVNEDDAPVYGPFPGAAMQAWTAAGAFSGERMVYVQRVAADGSIVDPSWRRCDDTHVHFT